MADQVIYDNTINHFDSFATGPTTKRVIIDVADNSNADYSLGESIFESDTIANNGYWQDYRNAYIDMPVVLELGSVGDATDFTSYVGGDLALALKSSNYNLIHSIQIDAGGNIYKSTDYINHFINFELNTKMDLNDEAINGPTLNFYKSTSESWKFIDVSTPYGEGLCNNANVNAYNNSSTITGLVTNAGLCKSQQNFISLSSDEKTGLLGTDINNYKLTGRKVIENTAKTKKYYFNMILRLRDLPFFDQMPLSRGCNFKITLRYNMPTFHVTKDAAGDLFFNPLKYTNRGGTNPVMFCASSIIAGSVKNEFGLDDVDTATSLSNTATTLDVYSGGSKMLECDKEYTVKLMLGGSSAIRRTGRLYVPCYELSPDSENALLSLPPRKITYTQHYFKAYKNVAAGSFQQLIHNGVSRPTRLVIMPFLSKATNTGFEQVISPFSDGMLCPHIISNINLRVAGEPIYKSNINYTYQMFLNEMVSNDKNENQIMGLVSSRISEVDYVNTYGYIVFDLRRRNMSEENVKKSLEFSCDILAPASLDLYCFVEYETDVTLDFKTGQLS